MDLICLKVRIWIGSAYTLQIPIGARLGRHWDRKYKKAAFKTSCVRSMFFSLNAFSQPLACCTVKCACIKKRSPLTFPHTFFISCNGLHLVYINWENEPFTMYSDETAYGSGRIGS